VLEGEDPQPDRRAQSSDERGNPGRGEARVEERGPAIEGGTGTLQHQQHRREERRFFVVKTLQESRHQAGDHRDRRQVVSRIQPADQTL
jgi:hypothetical protein